VSKELVLELNTPALRSPLTVSCNPGIPPVPCNIILTIRIAPSFVSIVCVVVTLSCPEKASLDDPEVVEEVLLVPVSLDPPDMILLLVPVLDEFSVPIVLDLPILSSPLLVSELADALVSVCPEAVVVVGSKLPTAFIRSDAPPSAEPAALSAETGVPIINYSYI
jgi:hypothetical protein